MTAEDAEKKKREQEALDRGKCFYTMQALNIGVLPKWKSKEGGDQHDLDLREDLKHDLTIESSPETKLYLLETGDYYDENKVKTASRSNPMFSVHFDKEKLQSYPIPFPKNKADARIAYRECILLMASQGVNPIIIEYGEFSAVKLDYVKLIVEEAESLGIAVRYGKNVQAAIHAKTPAKGKDGVFTSKEGTWLTAKQKELEGKRQETESFYKTSRDGVLKDHIEAIESGKTYKSDKDELRALIEKEVERKVKAEKKAGRNPVKDVVLKEYLKEHYPEQISEEDDNKSVQALLEQVLNNEAEVKGQLPKTRARIIIEEKDPLQQLNAMEKEITLIETQLKKIDTSLQERQAQLEGSNAVMESVKAGLDPTLPPEKQIEAEKKQKSFAAIREKGNKTRTQLDQLMGKEIQRLQALHSEYKEVLEQVSKPYKDKDAPKDPEEKKAFEDGKEKVEKLQEQYANLGEHLKEADKQLKRLEEDDKQLEDQLNPKKPAKHLDNDNNEEQYQRFTP